MSKSDNKFFNHSITRREALVTLGLASAASIAGIGFADRAAAFTQGGLPNIIFILSDDHRWDHMGCMGHPFIQTPAMDRLAAEGVLFENAFVTTSLCSPSRASFLTGTYAHTHGVKNNITPWNDSNVTFFDTMKARGYDTAFIGKWHMPGALPTIPAIDEFITVTAQGGQGQYFNCRLIVNGKPEPSRKPYITEELTDRAIEFIQTRKDRPFCLYLSHKAIHHQFLPPQDLKGLYNDVDLNLPKEYDPRITYTKPNIFQGVIGPLKVHYRNYCAALTALDREIGRLLDKLDEYAIADNTLVVYAGDNGYFWGEHNLVDKRFAYEESMRIPFIVRWPSYIPDPGRRADQMVLNVDLAPTLSDVTASPMSDRFEGASFMQVLKSASVPGRQDWFYEYYPDFPYRIPGQYAVRTKTHKYIEFMTGRKPELYDIANDPTEHHNLYGAAEGDRIQKELKDRLKWYKGRYGLDTA